VFVNRQWAQFFGRGIVDTLADFGKSGAKPTHPDLLDHLAGEFVAQGWSVKDAASQAAAVACVSPGQHAAHRRRGRSGQQAAVGLPAPAAGSRADPRLAARRQRACWKRSWAVPRCIPPIPANFDIGGQRNRWVTSTNPHDHHRRSLYVFVLRNSPYPLLDTFDWANPQSVHNRREVTTTAPQALALVNSDLVLEWSKALAGRVLREAGPRESAQLARVYEILYARKPSTAEQAQLTAFLNAQEALLREQPAQGAKAHVPEGYGVAPELSAQIDHFYRALYRRAPDRYEQAALVAHLDQQKTRLGSGSGAGDDDGGAPAPADAAGTAGTPKPGPRREAGLSPARATAFVDLVHTLVNANEFTYRF
jgi:hypothetical protein